jgi:cysteine-rich repeat protein
MCSNSVAGLCAIAASAGVLSCGKTQTLGDGFDETNDGTGGRVSAVAGGGRASSGAVTSNTGGAPTGGLIGDPVDLPKPALDTCGDGIVHPAERCDDANVVAGDGCDGECQLEPGFVCSIPGQPCSRVVRGACEDGCFAGDLCVERASGFECECPEPEPDPCGVGIRILSRNGNARCTPYAISNDGTTAAGICDVVHNELNSSAMVLWHLGESPQLEELLNTSSYVPTALNTDGSVVVGRCPQGTFHWTREGTEIIQHDGFRHASVSADGTTVVGTRGVGPFQPFLWTKADGVVLLPEPDDGVDSIANVISDDGSVIGGMSYRTDGNGYAIRWNASREVEWLPIGDGVTSSEVIAASADGEVLVGYSVRRRGVTEGELWASNVESMALPQIMIAVSDDGTGSVGQGGFYFDDGEYRSLDEFLPTMLPQYWSSLTIVAASGDLKTFVGTASPITDDPSGDENEAILVVLPP